jgi:CheY-like chemotaxis protein
MISPDANLPFLAALRCLGPHDHVCSIYETAAERYAVAIPFFRIGLDRAEKCIYIADTGMVDDAAAAMRAAGIDVEGALRSGALLLATKESTYLRHGPFDPERILASLDEAARAAVADGFTALRAAAETEWLIPGGPSLEGQMEYESRLTGALANCWALALCQYDRRRLPAELILDVLHTHPIVIYRGTVCRNLYYFTPPEEFLAEDRAAREVERLLNTIREYGHGGREPAIQSSAAAARGGVSEAEPKKCTVLVVDDEEYAREFMQDSLKRAGYRALGAADGDQALRILRADRRISLVLLDLIMPVRSGDVVLDDIARERPDVAVLVTSGHSEEMARRLIATGARRAFIQKPYTAAELVRKVGSVLAG